MASTDLNRPAPAVTTGAPESRYSFCRNCPASCGMTFKVENNRVVSHEADRLNVLSHGFQCIKGTMAIDFMNGAEPRLVNCQKRLPGGRFADITPEEAVAGSAAKLKELLAAYGPECVALYHGTASYTSSLTLPMAKTFLAAISSSKLFSTMTIDQSAHWVADGRMGMFATGRPFLQDVDVLCVVGSNPFVSHATYFIAMPPDNQLKRIGDLKKRGGALIVIDPRKTETAKRADLHIQPRPGFDAEIFAAMIGIVLAEGLQDRAFCDRYVAHVEELRAAVAPFTPDLVAERAGVPVDHLYAAARMVAGARKPSVGFGTGAAMARNPNLTGHIIEAFNALCGGFLRAGDIIRHPGVFMKRPTVESVYPPDRTWDRAPRLRSGHGLIKNEFPSSRLADDILTPGDGKIRALFVVCANPLMAFGEPERMREALRDLDLLVVLDPRMTETAALAHYVIAPPLQFETTDTTTYGDTMFHEPFVQYADPVVTPPAGVLPEWKYFNGVANALGMTLSARPQVFGAKLDGGLELTTGVDWSGKQLIDYFCAQAGLDLDELKRSPHGMTPDFPTSVVSAPEQDDGARLDLCPPDVAAELAALVDLPAVAGKYLLISRRIVETMNSMFRNNPITRRRHPTNWLYMHPDDLIAEGLADGDAAIVAGAHGRVIGYAKSDASMRRGVVSMTHCWGAVSEQEDPDGVRGAHLGRLVSMRIDDVQPVDGMPLQSGIPVDITPRPAALQLPTAVKVDQPARDAGRSTGR